MEKVIEKRLLAPNRALLVILSTMLLLSGQPLNAKAASTTSDVDPLFRGQNSLKLTLSGPFSEINEEKDKSKEYRGTVEYIDENAPRTLFDVKFSARGNSRLQAKECRSAQLWVDFKKSQTAGTIFEGQNKLKLVVQCGSKSRGSQWLLKENLAYKVFEEFSDLHLKTRLLEVSYTDTDKREGVKTQLAFFIEHHKSVARRHAMQVETRNAVSIAELDQGQSNAVALFAYLIGNTDFSSIQGPAGEKCCHNVKLLVDDKGQYFPLPYDFDNTGWVSAGYALGPSPNIGIASTAERSYRGFCSHNQSLYEDILDSASYEANILAHVDNTEGLSNGNKRKLRQYAGEFFEMIGHPMTTRELIKDCRYPQEFDSSDSSD